MAHYVYTRKEIGAVAEEAMRPRVAMHMPTVFLWCLQPVELRLSRRDVYIVCTSVAIYIGNSARHF